MRIVPLTPVANQSLSFSVDGAYWQVHLYQTNKYMAVDIKRGGELLVSGLRVVGGTLVLPYDYLWSPNFGNMVFDADPDWEQFGSNCTLYYLSHEEAKQWQSLQSQPI